MYRKKIIQCFIASDTVPATLLKSWDIEADIFDGEILAWPVPTLFSTNPSATLDAILKAPEKVKINIKKIKIILNDTRRCH